MKTLETFTGCIRILTGAFLPFLVLNNMQNCNIQNCRPQESLNARPFKIDKVQRSLRLNIEHFKPTDLPILHITREFNTLNIKNLIIK
jgi:hypothetical protein